MAHQVDEAFPIYSGVEAAWHGIANVTKEYLTSAEAIKAASLDWDVVKVPLDYNWNGAPNRSGKVSVVRATDGREVGVVTKDYVPLQNRDAFEFCDSLVGEGITYETAGCLKGGSIVFLLVRMPAEILIAGEKYYDYFMLLNSHDGSRCVEANPATTRVVCMNTLRMELNDRKKRKEWIWRTSHRGDMKKKLEEAKAFFKFAGQHRDFYAKKAESFLDIRVTDMQYKGIVENLFPYPEEAKEFMLNRVNEKRSNFYRAFDSDDLANIRNTGWGVLQAVADVESHKKPLRETPTWQENRFLDVLRGTDLSKKAEELVLALS